MREVGRVGGRNEGGREGGGREEERERCPLATINGPLARTTTHALSYTAHACDCLFFNPLSGSQ